MRARGYVSQAPSHQIDPDHNKINDYAAPPHLAVPVGVLEGLLHALHRDAEAVGPPAVALGHLDDLLVPVVRHSTARLQLQELWQVVEAEVWGSATVVAPL